MFPDLKAKRVYCVEGFDQTAYNRVHLPTDHPFSPVSVGSQEQRDGGRQRRVLPRHKMRPWRQLYLYKKPLEKPTPDAVIELPLGAAGEIQFDADDNLVVMDHTWNKVWVINYHKDPAWLKPIK